MKAVIFDLDGTILDTESLWQDASLYLLDTYASHLNQNQKDEIIKRLPSLTLYENIKLLQELCSIDSIEEAGLKKRKYVHSIYETNGIPLVPYFLEFHDKVVRLGLKHAIATNTSQVSLDKIATFVPLKNYFAEHIYPIEAVNRIFKPQPDIFLHAAKMLDVDPVDCIVIEDSAAGIAAAKAAGMYCIAINTGKNRELLRQADKIVDCYREIDLEKLISKN